MVQQSNTAFGLPANLYDYSFMLEAAPALYPYVALNPTLQNDLARAKIAAGATTGAARASAAGGVQQQQIATQGSLQQTLAQIAAQHQSSLMDTSKWLAQMQGSGQLRDTIGAMAWRAGQAPQPGATSAWSGPVPQLEGAFAPPSSYIPQALAMAGGQGEGRWADNEGRGRRTYSAAQGMPRGGNYGVLVGDGAGVQPGVSEVVNVGPNGKFQGVTPIMGTAATGFTPPTDPSGLTMGQGVGPPAPAFRPSFPANPGPEEINRPADYGISPGQMTADMINAGGTNSPAGVTIGNQIGGVNSAPTMPESAGPLYFTPPAPQAPIGVQRRQAAMMSGAGSGLGTNGGGYSPFMDSLQGDPRSGRGNAEYRAWLAGEPQPTQSARPSGGNFSLPSGFGSSVSGVPSGFMPTPGSPLPSGAGSWGGAFNYGNSGQASNPNMGTGPSSGNASIPPAPAFSAPIGNPINNLPFVQALRPGGMAPPQFQQYGSQPAFAEIGINAVNSPFQAASNFAQLTPYDQEQSLQLWESMGIPRMVALAEMANATPGFRMNPVQAFSYS